MSTDQRKGVFGLNNGLNGLIISRSVEHNSFTWLTKPNKGRTSGHRCQFREIPDSVQIFREWLNRSVGYADSGEVYGTLCELECVRVEDYSCSADENEVINGPQP